MKYFRIALIVFFTFIATSVLASNDFSVFEDTYEIKSPEMLKPTVVSTMLPGVQRYGVAIMEAGNEVAQPVLSLSQYTKENDAQFTVSASSPLIGEGSALVDGDIKTSAEFNLDQDKGLAWIELKSDKAISSSSLRLDLDSHVSLPYEIDVSAFVDGDWKTVVAKTKLKSSYLSFPETNSDKWKIRLYHGQPLRLRELVLGDKAKESLKTSVEIRWLARPGMTYTLYSQARQYASIQTAEGGALQGKDLEVIKVEIGTVAANPLFAEPDDDKDGVPNLTDNCISLANVDQLDIDNNGRGDVCEDFDGDGIMNSKDSCPDHPNRYQKDEDGDGIGDACDDEESRVTERNPWLPWAAMGLTGLIVILIVVQTIKATKKEGGSNDF